jgi:hypothetical protein
VEFDHLYQKNLKKILAGANCIINARPVDSTPASTAEKMMLHAGKPPHGIPTA